MRVKEVSCVDKSQVQRSAAEYRDVMRNNRK